VIRWQGRYAHNLECQVDASVHIKYRESLRVETRTGFVSFG